MNTIDNGSMCLDMTTHLTIRFHMNKKQQATGEQLCQSGVRIASEFHINIPSGRPMATVNANLIGPHNSIPFSIQFDWRSTITNEPHLTCPRVVCQMSLCVLESAFLEQQMVVVL